MMSWIIWIALSLRFKGPNEKERIGAVFRYLDPGGEGNVSIQEWQILDQLWKESGPR